MNYVSQETSVPANGIQEMSFDEIELVDGGKINARDIGIWSGVGGAVASAAGIGLALSAAGPVGFAVGFGLGITGVFLSSAGIGASLASR